jgi:alkylated DNA repair dioxygenase AlkB
MASITQPPQHIVVNLPKLEGLLLMNDVISREMEIGLISNIDQETWSSIGPENSRRVQQYGFTYVHKALGLSEEPARPLPDYLSPAITALATHLKEFVPNQLIVNEYVPGQGIGFHVDETSVFGDTIAILSLGSGIAMRFKRGEETGELYLTPRSLLVLKDEARYEWQHGISRARFDVVNGVRVPRERRVSLTFRDAKS